MKLRTLSLLIIIPILTWANESTDMGQIAKRIAPVGKVNISDEIAIEPVSTESPSADTPSKPVASAKKVAITQERVNTIYTNHCAVCHAAGVAGAPKKGDKKAWEERIAKTGIKGKEAIVILLKSSVKGINAMPPMGTCMDCSNDELKAAIEFMMN